MLNPKHILITGASSGLGAALAESYAASGVTLSLHGRNAERLADVAARCTKLGAMIATHSGDVSDADGMAAWITERDAAQPIDLIIANAGISLGSGDLHDSPTQSEAIFATNVTGVFNTVQPALPLMVKRRYGQIAIMSSIASFRGFAGAASYCASKAAVRVYGEALRAEVAPHGVDVNVICPGYIKTPMTDKNMFPMPFIMSPERAVGIIRRGLATNKPRIAFPWPMYALVRLVAALPQDFVNRRMWKLPKKG